ncbi:lysine transporter LysE [Acuticoccus sediminis]|uniref:Lysine transporter LysE n=1 Tax=Acuticoccus sediminis TaxID=2184697 RepID=A0A8B2NRX5_9HYPH|nr:LysE family translocator [Acuticoccus sediminis]RAI01060.1 lysine transporter LysE [Acuticoccus sediminis]
MDAATLAAVAMLWTAAAMMPGPNFLIVATTAVQSGRHHALVTVGGVVLAVCIWATAGYLGISTLFALAPWLYATLKLAGGIYLIVVGITLLRASGRKGASAPAPEVAVTRRLSRSFVTGFVVNMSNPKTAIFMASIFATVLPAHAPVSLGVTTIMLTTAISTLWYGFVAVVMSRPAVQRFYRDRRAWVTRAAGGLFTLFGVKVAAWG